MNRIFLITSTENEKKKKVCMFFERHFPKNFLERDTEIPECC